jgi:hypothetical protein
MPHFGWRTAVKLIKRTVDGLTCNAGRKDRIFFDDDIPGVGIRVTDKGAKTWLIQYRAAGMIRRMKLGSVNVLAPDKARERAKELLGGVAGGCDPFEEAVAAIKAARLERIKVLAAAHAETFTLKALIDEFDAKHASRKRSGAETLRALRTNFVDWLDRPAHSFTAAEMVKHLDQIAEARWRSR